MIYSPSTRILRGGAAMLAAAFALSGVAGVNALHADASKPAKAPPGGPGGPGILGTLKSASANTLKITTLPAHGTATVKLSPKTTYRVNGRTTKTHPTWKRGEQVQVTGSKSKTGAYLATTVSVGTPPAPPGGPAPGGPGGPGGAPPTTGKVVSATSTKLTLKTSQGTKTYTLKASTQYLVNGKATSSRPSLSVGRQVAVVAKGSIAQTVFVGSMPAPPSGNPPPSR